MEMAASISKLVCTGCMLGAGEPGSSLVVNETCQRVCTEACMACTMSLFKRPHVICIKALAAWQGRPLPGDPSAADTGT